tara:strand:+ start:133 stop:1056 length:924 start_codon:yes stop_codon:yes gene_type:complete
MNNIQWNNFLNSLNELEAYQKKVRQGYVKDRNQFTQTGPQKKGGAPFSKKPPKTRSKSAPPGFGGALEEIEVDQSGFEVHDALEPEIWQEQKLNPEIAEALREIANDFIEGLEVDVNLEDLTITGSLANFNWSKYSDVDLHLIVDFSKVDDDVKLVKSYFDEARMRWNNKHDIKIKGYDVEIYVENTGEEHISTGIYSILNEQWTVEPKITRKDIDFETAKKKAEDVEDRYFRLKALFNNKKYEEVAIGVERVKQKIRDMRKVGLESDKMEFSAENIAFKILRRAKILDGLSKLKYNAYDQSMTVDD